MTSCFRKNVYVFFGGERIKSSVILMIFFVENAVLCGTMYDLIDENHDHTKNLLLEKFEDESLVAEMASFVGKPFTLKEEIESFGKENNMEFFKVSAHNGFNVKEVFERAIRIYYMNRPPMIRAAVSK